MLRFLIILTTLCLTTSVVRAQEETESWLGPKRALSRWIGTAYLDWGITSHIFARNMDERNGFGAGGELLFNVQKKQPFWVGIGVHSFALDDYRLSYTQEVDGVLYTYEDRTTSRIFAVHGLMRFQPEIRFLVQPYVQAAFGPHWYFTNTKIRDLDLDEQVDRLNESRDMVLGFALTGGVQIVPRQLPDIRADLRCSYFRNSSVEYLRYNPDLAGVFTSDSFEAKNSVVDLIIINIGVTVVLRPE